MKLYEFMAKEVFTRYQIPVAQGKTASSPEEVLAVAEEMGPTVIKAQVLVGGRGKAGGVGKASNPEEARWVAESILGREIKGHYVHKVLVEEQLPIDRELYVSITIDRALRQPIVILSAEGGVEIEQVPDEKIIKIPLDIHLGIQPYLAREMCRRLQIKSQTAKEAENIFINLYKLFRECQAELVEINPLVICGEKVIAADAKLIIDDEALNRIDPSIPRVYEKNEREREAAKVGVSYVELGGDIGVVSNGAGITMATLDILQHFGGRAGSFMDAGGGAGSESILAALKILISSKPKVILFNIFGGITRWDDIARGLIKIKDTEGIPVPLVLRVVGNNEDDGIALLKQHGFESYRSIQEAVARTLELARKAA